MKNHMFQNGDCRSGATTNRLAQSFPLLSRGAAPPLLGSTYDKHMNRCVRRRPDIIANRCAAGSPQLCFVSDPAQLDTAYEHPHVSE